MVNDRPCVLDLGTIGNGVLGSTLKRRAVEMVWCAVIEFKTLLTVREKNIYMECLII